MYRRDELMLRAMTRMMKMRGGHLRDREEREI
jgi:hypothetical protein